MPYKYTMPHTWHLLSGIPKEDLPESEAEFWKEVASELSRLIEYGSGAKSPEIVFSECRKAGTQYIWEFWVNDLDLPHANTINWHGQNTSRWKYAGAIVLQKGKVSSHH